MSNLIGTVKGSYVNTVVRIATNRTGAALAKGDVVALDLTGSDGDVSAYGTDKEDPYSNVIAVGAGHDDGWRLLVALETIANDADGKFAESGIIDVECVGSSGVAAGGRVAPTSGQTYVSGEADGLAVCGIALEAGPTGAAGTIKVDFWGNCFYGAQAEV